MNTLLIDNENLEFISISGKDACRQRLQNRLKLFRGEWFLDTTAGMPYFNLLDRRVTEDDFAREIRSILSKDPEVVGILDISVTFVRTAAESKLYQVPMRTAILSFSVQTLYGTIEVTL